MPDSSEKDVAFPIPPREAAEIDSRGRTVGKWAKWSFLCSVYALCFVLLIVMLLLSFTFVPEIMQSYAVEVVLDLLILLVLVLACIGFLAGITGLIQIIRSKGQLAGFGKTLTSIVVSLIVLSPVLGMQALGPYIKRNAPIWLCKYNLERMYEAIKTYRDSGSNSYPAPDQWCDLLQEKQYVSKSAFWCKGGEYSLHDSNQMFSYYAMNPDCEPNSPGDVVLLFDTKPGWNQHGGAELLAPENHRGEGCNILFNDGTVKFVKKKHFDNLRWK
jgi:hypothetical protein